MHPRREFGFPVAGKRRRSPEFPCVSRFRQRRLISFLSQHKFYRTLDVFVTQTDVFMCMKHLNNLVQEGSWGDAIDYLSRFMPSDSDRRLGIHGRALFHFLRVHKAIDDSHAITRLRAIFSSLLCSKKFRAALDLKRVRLEASMTVIELIYKTPELKDHMSPFRGPTEPQKVLPMGFGYASFRPRHHMKKRRGPAPASVVAGLYLQKKKMLPSLASCAHSQGLSRETLIKAKEWLVDLVDACLEAGKKGEEDLPECARTKSAHVTPVSQANIATFKRPFSDNELLRKAEEWAVYLIDERLEIWPDMTQDYPPPFPCKDGDHVDPVLQTMPDSLTNADENSAVPTFSMPVTYKDLMEEYYYGSRKNKRMAASTSGEGSDPKRRRTTLIEPGTEDQLAA
ncbi:unnamed protein product [Alopecurus aequalis]